MIGSSIVSSHADGLDKLARHARVVLIVLGVIQLASAAFLWLAQSTPDMQGLWGMIFVGLVFVGLAGWARERPMAAILTGLAIYLVLVAVDAAMNPASLTQGLVGKLIIAVMFYNGISTALTHNNMARMQLAAPTSAPRVATAAVAPLRARKRRGAATGANSTSAE